MTYLIRMKEQRATLLLGALPVLDLRIGSGRRTGKSDMDMRQILRSIRSIRGATTWILHALRPPRGCRYAKGMR